jgi:hypothetical protein
MLNTMMRSTALSPGAARQQHKKTGLDFPTKIDYILSKPS